MVEAEQFKEPKDLVDEIVGAVSRQGVLQSDFPALEALRPWLRLWGTREPYHVEAVTMPLVWFVEHLNDGDLLQYVTMKPWEEITDDMRVNHALRRLEEFAEHSDEFLALHEIKGRDGKSAIVAFVCTNGDTLAIIRLLGAWRSLDSFWSDYLAKNIDTEFPPTRKEILSLWEHYCP